MSPNSWLIFLLFNIPTDTPKHFTSLRDGLIAIQVLWGCRAAPLFNSKRPIRNSRHSSETTSDTSQKHMEFLNGTFK